MIQKILRLFVNTLTVNDKHYDLNRDNLTQAIQISLPQKQKTFFEFFLAFLKSILIFKHLRKKMALVALVFLEIPAPRDIVR